jgi:hypothetical protein
LLDLSHDGRQPIDRRIHSNQEMAARISTVPEALSRSLKLFKDNQQIRSSRVQILVREPGTLAQLAQIGPHLFRG